MSGYALHTSLVLEAVPDADLEALGITGKKSDVGADRKGTKLLAEFQRMLLTEPMRAADDKRLAKNLECQRDTTCPQPVTEDFIDLLISQQLTADAIQREGERAAAAASARHPLPPAELEAVAERARTALRFAKIGVLSQRERHAFNLLQARLFARHHRRPLFWWKQPLVGVAASYIHWDGDRAGLPRGARRPVLPLCGRRAREHHLQHRDGARSRQRLRHAELHSLTLAGDTTLDSCLANTVWNDQYGIWEVQIEPPLSVCF